MFNILESFVQQGVAKTTKQPTASEGSRKIFPNALTVGANHRMTLSKSVFESLKWQNPNRIYTFVLEAPDANMSIPEDVAFVKNGNVGFAYLCLGNETPRDIAFKAVDAAQAELEKDSDTKMNRNSEEFTKLKNEYLKANYKPEEINVPVIGMLVTEVDSTRLGFSAPVDPDTKGSTASWLRGHGGEVFEVRGAKGFMVAVSGMGEQLFGIVENDDKEPTDTTYTYTYINAHKQPVPFKDLKKNSIALVKSKFLRKAIDRVIVRKKVEAPVAAETAETVQA